MKPTTLDAYKLMHDGNLVHAQIEANGMRIDEPRLDVAIEEVGQKIKRGTERLKQDKIWKLWCRRFGENASLGSRHQMGEILYKELGHKSGGVTKKSKRPCMDEEALSKIDLPFVRNYLKVGKLKIFLSTHLRGIRREVLNGYLRPSFNLNLATTYRPSCNRPNFQNIPTRDEESSKLIRGCFIPRDGHVLVETDYGGHEFRIAACFWCDKAMVEYVSDPGLDIHRDMAAECYLLEADQVTGGARFYAKNQFVFPTLYGSWYKSCTRNLWDVIEKFDLKTNDGIGLYKHLLSMGIEVRGRCESKKQPMVNTFESHIQEVEKGFNERFPQWSDRKEQWWAKYQKQGWFRTMTGFVVVWGKGGVCTRNNAFNTPIQGPAFHCLLWSMIELQRWLVKEKMRTKIVGEIHDSIVADVHEDELDDYIAMAEQIMARDIRKAWPWIIVPLLVEHDVYEKNWYEKRVA